MAIYFRYIFWLCIFASDEQDEPVFNVPKEFARAETSLPPPSVHCVHIYCLVSRDRSASDDKCQWAQFFQKEKFKVTLFTSDALSCQTLFGQIATELLSVAKQNKL